MSLRYIRLSSRDMECVAVFLSCSSHKEWELLGLDYCYIQDHGLHILYFRLTSCDIIFRELRLQSNGLTVSSSSALSDITISCRVKKLHIGGKNTVGEDERLYSIII